MTNTFIFTEFQTLLSSLSILPYVTCGNIALLAKYAIITFLVLVSLLLLLLIITIDNSNRTTLDYYVWGFKLFQLLKISYALWIGINLLVVLDNIDYGLICRSSTDLSFTCLINSYFSSFIVNCDSAPDQFVPYAHTASLDKGIVALCKMYESLTPGSLLQSYLANNASHLLEPLVGASPIPVNMTEVEQLVSHPATISLGENHTVQYTKGLTQSGIYAFFKPDLERISQVGSNMDYFTRLRVHYDEYKDSPKPFYSGGLSQYLWNPIHSTTNYELGFAEFAQANDTMPSAAESYITRAFTQQEIRSLEQAVDTFAKPVFYEGTPVNTWHNSWTPGKVIASSNGKNTSWVTMEGVSYSAPSMQQAASVLDLSIRSVERVSNCSVPYFINSPSYGKVQIFIDEGTMRVHPNFEYTKPQLVGIDTASLTPNKIYVFNTDLQQLPMGPYNSVPEANLAIGQPQVRQNWRWVNTEHALFSPVLNIAVYYVSYKVSTKMPAILHNLTDGTTTNLPSMYSAAKLFGITARTGFMKSYVLGRRIYKHNDKQYLIEFEDPEHHISTKLRIQKDARNSYHAEKASKAKKG